MFEILGGIMDPKLKQTLFDHLCTLLKRLDPEIFNPLISHAGKTIHLEIINLLSLTFKIQSDGLVLADEALPSQYHTILSGRLSDFMLASRPNNTAIVQNGLTLKGDLHCARDFDACLKHMDLDWEGFFADKIGDNAAVALSTFFKKTRRYIKDMVQTRAVDAVYFVQDEKPLVPLKPEVEAFYNDVDQLKLDVERFEAKLKSHLC